MVGKSGDSGPAKEQELIEVLEQVRKALAGLQFGEVRVTVQDGVVVQVERTERIRLDRPASRSSRRSGEPRPARGLPPNQSG